VSCAEGTLARTGPKELTPVEKLFEGADLYGERGEAPALVTQPLQYAMRPCVTVTTNSQHKIVCEVDHDFRLCGGGYVAASESLHRSIRTPEGMTEVISVKKAGIKRVVMIHAEPTEQPYETNGILS
jgi:hypothetical protein